MQVITRRRLVEFASLFPEADDPLDRWYRIAKRAAWASFAQVREDFPQADLVDGLTVFNIGGNKFRLVVKINFRTGLVFIRRVLTHGDYDKGSWKS